MERLAPASDTTERGHWITTVLQWITLLIHSQLNGLGVGDALMEKVNHLGINL